MEMMISNNSKTAFKDTDTGSIPSGLYMASNVREKSIEVNQKLGFV